MGRRVLGGERLDRPDLFRLVELAGARPHDLLYWAHRVRAQRFGSAVRLCSIVPGKLGGCGEDCKWCAQSVSRDARPAKPARTPLEQIVTAASQAAEWGAASLGIVNSGRRPAPTDLQCVIDAAEAIRRKHPDAALAVCASLGELSQAQAARLVEAGITRYNHNLETSERLFPELVSTHTYADRVRTLTAARKAGMRLCCGGIFGVGEDWEDRITMGLMLRDVIQPDIVPMNFLHPIPGTPLETATPLRPMEILTVIAVYRLMLPDADLKIAGGREANLRDLQSWMFYAGGTSCIVGSYLTTTGRDADDDLEMIQDLGLTVAKNFTSSDTSA